MPDFELCPECNHQNRGGAKFCDNCGAKTISQTQVEPPSAQSNQYSNPPLEGVNQKSFMYKAGLWSAKLPLQARYVLIGGVAVSALIIFSLLISGKRDSKSNYQDLSEKKEEKPATSTAASRDTTARAEPLKGSAGLKDRTGDVRDGDGRRPRGNLSEIDLVEVIVEYAGSDLQITHVVDGLLPSSYPVPDSAIWTVTACSPDGNECVSFDIRCIKNWSAYWWSVGNAYQHKVKDPEVYMHRFITRFPLDQLPAFIKKPFKWRASSERNTDRRYNDRVPDGDYKFARFPAK